MGQSPGYKVTLRETVLHIMFMQGKTCTSCTHNGRNPSMVWHPGCHVSTSEAGLATMPLQGKQHRVCCIWMRHSTGCHVPHGEESCVSCMERVYVSRTWMGSSAGHHVSHVKKSCIPCTDLGKTSGHHLQHEKQFWIVSTLLRNSPGYHVSTQKTIMDVMKAHGKISWAHMKRSVDIIYCTGSSSYHVHT